MEKEFTVGIRLSFARSNVVSHLRWLEYLSGPAFATEFLRRWQMPFRLRRIRRLAQEVIQEEIYDQYAPSSYKRTYRLLNSPATETQSTKRSATVTLYLDPDVSPEKGFRTGPGLGNSRGEFSYGFYFQDPRWNSFLYRTVKQSYVIRPFRRQMIQSIVPAEEREALTALVRAASFKKPRAV